MHYVLTDDHKTVPATLEEWASFFEGRAKRRVALTEEGDIAVSTVFLGLDHNWGEGPPLLFETMIFGGPHDEEQWRYSTWDEAVAGHQRACEIAGILDSAPE
jgi:hypothetical protein